MVGRESVNVQDTIYLVTGAPGSGKSTALEHFLQLKSAYLAFDIDWLAHTASDLAGRDVITDASIGKPYTLLWFDILRAVCRNHRNPLFFSPLDPRDTVRISELGWHPTLAWLLLDCGDEARRERLKRRPGWTEDMIREALDDAIYLRQVISNRVDTSTCSPEEVARRILAWVRRTEVLDDRRSARDE